MTEHVVMRVTVEDPEVRPKWIPDDGVCVAALVEFPDRIVKVYWTGRTEVTVREVES